MAKQVKVLAPLELRMIWVCQATREVTTQGSLMALRTKMRRQPWMKSRPLRNKKRKKLRLWKYFVVASILITGALVSIGVYSFLSGQQEDDLRHQVRILCRHEPTIVNSVLQIHFFGALSFTCTPARLLKFRSFMSPK